MVCRAHRSVSLNGTLISSGVFGPQHGSQPPSCIHLIISDAHWDHSRRLLRSFYFVQKLVGIQAAVQLLTEGFSIWVENAYSCLKNRFMGDLPPK